MFALIRCTSVLSTTADFASCRFFFAFLLGKEMPARGVLTQHLPGRGDLEPFGNGFPGLAARDRFRHKARKIGALLRD